MSNFYNLIVLWLRSIYPIARYFIHSKDLLCFAVCLLPFLLFSLSSFLISKYYPVSPLEGFVLSFDVNLFDNIGGYQIGLNVCRLTEVTCSNPISTSHFDCRWQFLITQIVIALDLLGLHVVLCHSNFRVTVPGLPAPSRSWRFGTCFFDYVHA